jgi:hypothetical protein
MVPLTPKLCGNHRKVPRKSNAGRSLGVALLVVMLVVILLVAATVL